MRQKEMQKTLLSLALMSACSEAVPVTISYANPDQRPVMGRDPILDMLEGTFGLAFEKVGENLEYGALNLDIVDTTDNIRGKAYTFGMCRKVARSSMVDSVIAHEVGHMLGLGHSGDPENLMYHTANASLHLTQSQLDGARSTADLVIGCVP